MKRFLLIVNLFFLLFASRSQTEIEINFDAVNQFNGNSIPLDSVYVENVTQGIDTVLYAPFSLVLTDAGIGNVHEASLRNRDLKVYPNPFNRNTQIEFQLSENQTVSVDVFDFAGRIECSLKTELQKGIHKFRFEAGSSGVYFVSVNGRTQKVISLNGNNFNSNSSSIKWVGNAEGSFKASYNQLDNNDTTIVYFPYTTGEMMHFVGYSEGYVPFSIYDSPTSSTSYTMEMGVPFYRITGHEITTEIPSFVNVMFSVTDTNFKGIDYLTNDDFIVEEDNNPVSPTETFRYVRKLDMLDYELKTALILDNSASVVSVLDSIKSAAISFVEQKEENQEFAVFAFSSTVGLIQDYTDDITALVSAINSIAPGYASTNLYGAVIEGVNSWDDIYTTEFVRKGFGVVFTDGDDTQGTFTLADALAAKGDKILFMVGLGDDVNQQSLNQLSTGGQYISIDNISQLEPVFAEIQQDIILFANSYYLLNYMSPKRNGVHDLKVMMDPNTNTGLDSYITGTFNADDFVDVFSGTYVNISAERLYGIDSILFRDTNRIDLKATTYWAYDVPDFSWQLLDTSIARITVDDYNARSTLENRKKGITQIMVEDIANNYSKTITVVSNYVLPVADFYTNKTTVGVGGSVGFTDTTTNNPKQWFWTFGDGNSSYEQNPVHVFNSPGTYSVMLVATNDYGKDTLTKTDHITVDYSPVAGFVADQTYVPVNTAISFTDNSLNGPGSWLWDFGDGNTSDQQNPQHTYNTHGIYTVSLAVSNPEGSDTLIYEDYIEVVGVPVAAFAADKTTIGVGGEIQFTDNSLNDPVTWEWDFGNGETSVEQNPAISFSSTGTYSVELTAGNIAGTDALIKPDYILVNNQPVADFKASTYSSEPEMMTSFTDLSLNNPASWSWDFGDGNTSSLQNPQNSYQEPGTYTVSLTATNGEGTDILVKNNSISVSPGVEWDHEPAGGQYMEQIEDIKPTADGGYICTGAFQVDLEWNWLIVKLNEAGFMSWHRILGGSEAEFAFSIQQTSDGGYIVAGESSSDDGDLTFNHGGRDVWVVKLDGNGNITWQRSYGGSHDDYAFSIQETLDGGFIVAGRTSSDDGDVLVNYGGDDFWILKLDSIGNVGWQKTMGGSGYDVAYSIQQTVNGGYIVAGETNSGDGHVSGNHGAMDYWVVKLDGSGNTSWQKCLGGSQTDNARSIQQTSDGGYVVAGYTESDDGDVTVNRGYRDYWVVKLDVSGNIAWQNSLGGSGYDAAHSIQQTGDGGFIIAGNSGSDDGDIIGNEQGYICLWVVKLDPAGNLYWQKCFGSEDYSGHGRSVCQTSDGGYVAAGYKENYGIWNSVDNWVVKVFAE